MLFRILLACFLSALLCASSTNSVAYGKTVEAKAELVRLQFEIDKLTRRNAWKGVERTYNAMLDLELELRPVDHMAGEYAARNRGDINIAYARLQEAIPSGSNLENEAEPNLREAILRKTSIETRYGLVKLEVQQGRIPALVRFEWPFARDERVCIETSRTTLGEERKYEGFLPIGKYMIDGKFFEVSPGLDLLDLVISPPEN